MMKIESKRARRRKRKKKKKKALKESGKLAKDVVNLLAPAIGGYLGGPTGALIGRAASNVFSHIVGSGEYKLRNNTLVDRTGGLRFSRGVSKTVIKHREYVGQVESTGIGFSSASFNINPKNSTLFPWLSNIAAGYQKYVMKGLVFEFKSNSGTAVGSTNTALGVVIMSTNYNPSDAFDTTRQQMEARDFTTSACPDESFYHAVECARNTDPLNMLYVEDDTTATDLDPKFVDMGIFTVATQGQQAASVLGELWVSYHIELVSPQLAPSVSSNYIAWHAELINPVSGSPTLLQSISVHSGSSNRINVWDANNLVIGKRGRYVVIKIASGVGINGCNAATSGTNVTDADILLNDTVNSLAPPLSSSVSAISLACFDVNLDSVHENGLIAINTLVFTTSITTAELMVVEIPTTMTVDTELFALMQSGFSREMATAILQTTAKQPRHKDRVTYNENLGDSSNNDRHLDWKIVQPSL
jgi:hypothetical protein